jgi:hypothetical protein
MSHVGQADPGIAGADRVGRGSTLRQHLGE